MFKRSEKKIKAVFKMQFQATQVPQLKAKSLMISLVPVDVGKPTVRLAKSPILEGTCTWENPIYETVKLIKETKTGRIREKFYYIIVSTGTSKAGFLGEVSIDFADLADATKPLNLTLPLQTSKSGAILHVTVQNMQGGSDSRHGDDSEALVDESCDRNLDTSGDLSEETSPHYERSLEDADSDNNDDESQNGANQIKMLERKLEISELEVQSLRKQIMKETRRGQQLSEQIVDLKAECEQHKLSPTCKNGETGSSSVQKETENLRNSVETMKQELQREKNLNKKLKLHIQKAEDSNSEYVLAMRDLSKKLEQKNTEISRLSSKIKDLRSGSEDLEASPRTNMDDNEETKQKIENLISEIEAHKKEKRELEMDVQRITQEYENLEMENKEITCKLEQNEREKMEIQQSYTESLATIKQFKSRVTNLEDEIRRQKRQYSESLNMIDELDVQVESLQKELEMQAKVFEEDIEEVNKASIEQEQRAIRAEDALRKTRWNNTNAAEKLQEEFKQLSDEMSLKIEENEKIAQRAVLEADDLRHKNEVLQELLQNAKDELQIRMDKSEQMRSSIEETEVLRRRIKEKDDMEKQLALVRKEAEKLKQENASMKSQIDQKKTKEDNMNLEVKKLRLKNNEVKNHLLELESEKQEMKKEMSKLKDGLRKKEQQVREKPALQNSATSGHDAKLLSEVALLKERNQSMEDELKEMHERYSEISLRFAEVEGERQQLVMALRNVKSGKKN